MTPEVELELMQRLHTYGAQFREARDVEKAMRAALRLSQEFFAAKEGAVVQLTVDGGEPEVVFSVPRGAAWDEPLLAGFLHGEKVQPPPDTMLARVRRRGRK